MKSDLEYNILGDDLQIVEIALQPNETVIAEAGAMIYVEDGISFEARMGDGSTPNQDIFGKLIGGVSRMISGESLFLTHFSNHSYDKRTVAFGAPYPGKIIAVNLAETSENLIVQKGGFLAASYGTKIALHLNQKFSTGLFGGEGFLLQRISGRGMVFIHAGGYVIEKQLSNETLRVDTGCIVAFEPSIDFSTTSSGSLKSMLFGGEGIFLATLSGTGKVWLQSLPVKKLIRNLAPRGKNSNRENQSLLGNIFEE